MKTRTVTRPAQTVMQQQFEGPGDMRAMLSSVARPDQEASASTRELTVRQNTEAPAVSPRRVIAKPWRGLPSTTRAPVTADSSTDLG